MVSMLATRKSLIVEEIIDASAEFTLGDGEQLRGLRIDVIHDT